jgi:peroxiredoxin
MHALGASLVTISPQTPDNSLSMAEKNDLQFEVLSDVGNKVARQFRLVFALVEILRPLYKQIGADLQKYNGDESYELPIPGTFVIAQDGTIRLASVDADYTHRLEPSVIIESLRLLSSDPATAEGDTNENLR